MTVVNLGGLYTVFLFSHSNAADSHTQRHGHTFIWTTLCNAFYFIFFFSTCRLVLRFLFSVLGGHSPFVWALIALSSRVSFNLPNKRITRSSRDILSFNRALYYCTVQFFCMSYHFPSYVPLMVPIDDRFSRIIPSTSWSLFRSIQLNSLHVSPVLL